VNEPGEPAVAENPFCTRRVRPGAIPFCFAADESAAALVERLRGSAWWGEIVGPHGSGKSALLATLIPLLAQAGRRPLLVELHDGQRRLPRGFWHTAELAAADLVIVDGYEQLGRLNRFLLKRFCRRRGLGLLATAHASVGLPGLFRTSVSRPLAAAIVEQLQRGHPPLATSADVAEQLARHHDDLRETLFALYDLYETRRQ
jgi:hypothetical protein